MRPEQTVQEGQQVGSQIKMLFLVLNIKESEKKGLVFVMNLCLMVHHHHVSYLNCSD